MIRFLMIALVAVLGMSAPRLAHAQVTVTRSPATAPTLGTTIRGTTATTFTVSTSGAVTRTSGDAIRLTGGSITTPTFSVNCGLLNLSGLCALRYIRVTITPVGGGAASVTRFRVGGLSGATYRTGSAPAEGSSVTFDLNPLGLLSTATFRLGMDVTLAANAPSGAHDFDYIVTVELVR
ncbi:hypothetical protein NI454_12710 [Brevundimonas diminuta]|uniref:hypothetical protein n=1 Tax=Brevundimonas diminuta TaxID=293 RepID=UPI002096D7F2|nr:hypothetical protein [Brevundimonas diminuta]MCO8030808.1 hypothetical protein [Brevundimonas diminuta]